MKINYDELIENLPDAFSKEESSNNYKLIQLNSGISEKIHDDIQTISTASNFNYASGAILEQLYGGRVNLKRGGASDLQYKILLQSKIMQNTTTGTHPELLAALTNILQCDASDIHITSSTPYKVTINNIPMETIGKASFTAKEVINIINRLLPTNVVVGTYNFTGTFELGENEGDVDDAIGFADEAETIGGYMGLLS